MHTHSKKQSREGFYIDAVITEEHCDASYRVLIDTISYCCLYMANEYAWLSDNSITVHVIQDNYSVMIMFCYIHLHSHFHACVHHSAYLLFNSANPPNFMRAYVPYLALPRAVERVPGG